MDKYSVELDSEKVTKAKATGICPVCGSDLKYKDPPLCSNCGTKPFEENKEKT